jgi:hypothetical protein
MTRFFLNVHDSTAVLDDEGSEYATVEKAFAEARQSTRELLADGFMDGEDRSDWTITVIDEMGATHCSARLKDWI